MKLLITTQIVDQKSRFAFFLEWITEFSKRYESVEVICLEKGEYTLPENVVVHSLGKESGGSKLMRALRFYKLVVSRSNKYDTVFVHMNQVYVLLAGLYWRLTGKKIALWYAHKSTPFSLKLAVPFVHYIFSIAEGSNHLSTKKLEFTGHGIKIDNWKGYPKKSQSKKCISIGRISDSKGHHVAIEALKLLHASGEKYSLDIVGTPVTQADKLYQEKCKQRVVESGLQEYVQFQGHKNQAEIAEMIGRSDIVVNTSKTGSLDKVVLEAMVCQRAVISSSDSLKSLSTENPLLIYTKPSDPKALTDAIQSIQSLSLESYNKAAKELVEIVRRNHSLESLVQKITTKMNEN